VRAVPGQLKTIDVNGGPNPDNLKDQETDLEAMLDVELVQALAPAATIIDYQTTHGNIDAGDDSWTNFNDMLRQIIADNAKSTPMGNVVSISYGGQNNTSPAVCARRSIRASTCLQMQNI